MFGYPCLHLISKLPALYFLRGERPLRSVLEQGQHKSAADTYDNTAARSEGERERERKRKKNDTAGLCLLTIRDEERLRIKFLPKSRSCGLAY